MIGYVFGFVIAVGIAAIFAVKIIFLRADIANDKELYRQLEDLLKKFIVEAYGGRVPLEEFEISYSLESKWDIPAESHPLAPIRVGFVVPCKVLHYQDNTGRTLLSFNNLPSEAFSEKLHNWLKTDCDCGRDWRRFKSILTALAMGNIDIRKIAKAAETAKIDSSLYVDTREVASETVTDTTQEASTDTTTDTTERYKDYAPN